jgi:hypothetical protein
LTTTDTDKPAESNPSSMSFFDFMARSESYANSELTNELDEYLRSHVEPFGIDPVQWWGSRVQQFPNLSKMARDILCIPGMFILYHASEKTILTEISAVVGSAVAVERIFSGGRDTISLRRASLKPETISTLMLLKQRLRLERQRKGLRKKVWFKG